MTKLRIGFIGGGNMAGSIIGGLVATGHHPEQLLVSEPDLARGDALTAQHGVLACNDNDAVAAQCDALILAVKPQVMPQVLTEIRDPVGVRKPVVISIAAGIPLSTLSAGLGGHSALVRAMPNTPALLRAGISGLCAAAGLGDEQRRVAAAILGAVGEVIWFEDESALDLVTAISGSGPAYFFLLMEALQAAGTAQGLSESDCRALVQHTALGAARLACASPDSPATLRARVTSPGGTTAAALEVLEQGRLRELVNEAVAAAARRAAELAQAGAP